MIATSSSAAAVAGEVGGKAARACDGCLRQRARWYCAADDAFLCQGCDASVHSSNPLARRHERLRLRPSAPLHHPPPAGGPKRERRDEVLPAWFRRKARTPRGGHAKSVGQVLSGRLVVPEAACGDSPEWQDGEGEVEVEDEQLLYRVPIFDPALAEFCSPPPPLEDVAAAASCCNEDGPVEDTTNTDAVPSQQPAVQFFPDGVANFEPTDAELREFAADMEALLGRGLDNGNEEDSFYVETLGLLDPVNDDGGRVKVETDGGSACEARGALACGLELEPEASDEMLDIDFDYGSPQETPDEKAASSGTAADTQFLQRSLSLTLNYDAVIQSWGRSPWTGEERPHVTLDDCWPHDYTGMWVVGGVVVHGGEELGADGGREARVSRYREKRRTRLFSKKIRYEVRKLNAEKRPRVKGRFVKRATAGGSVAVAGLA
ncbi:zinc finger protein CONSTANS-LIKE 16-like [Phragmites australis]|uniref:zinc finger protein CONSTANS-LIKE 16-like n=1 Tax=Phragmites australis TaxID=29695 RepID=UPI002D79E2F0|nr:zinc finger protein CONSTANS-LIKE 16-like [Phragmites australis]